MRTFTLILCALCALPFTAAAEMSAAEFDAYTRGKTLYYGNGAEPYGAEIYLPNRRVRWSFLDGECKDGEWFEANGMICFTRSGPSRKTTTRCRLLPSVVELHS